jgi:FkbM family methyltransferase
MVFLSYAQNFEDVMLWRALGHITEGVYVDIGAQHPRIDSVSRAFYEHGWRGVHVEPVPAFATLLRQDRPDESVLQLALGDSEGTLELNVFADTGLSTAIPDYAERHRRERGYGTEVIQVQLKTLESTLAFLDGKQVHWLKIDVEGFEEQVLRGWNSSRLRPWVLVVEATIPNSAQTDYEKWEHLVTAAGYRFVYFDGLNRFYIANEHPELSAAFSAPPNLFDGFAVSGQASWGLCSAVTADYQVKIEKMSGQLEHASERMRVMETDLAVAATDLATATATVTSLTHELQQQRQATDTLRWQAGSLRIELDRVYNSRSWRIALPLRRMSLLTRQVRTFLRRAVGWARRQPARIVRVLSGRRGPGANPARSDIVLMSNPHAPASARRLSPRAARLYAELKQTVQQGNQKKESN